MKLPTTLAAAVAIVTACLATPVTAQTPEELFNEGNAAYEDGDYGTAVQKYDMVLLYGIHDPRVEYNLGNAYFRLGRIGDAILHYERALRMDPTDPDIIANLEFARSRRFDRVDPPEEAAVVRWLRGAQNRVGPDRQAVVVLALVWIAAALIAWGAARPGNWNAFVGWALAGVLVLSSLVGASWYTTHHRIAGARLAVVLADTVEILAGPGENNASLFTVHEGLTLEVRDERPDWIHVSLPNGLNGWLPREAVGFV
ncbi:MAG: tetratricopeptide repeat protein [Acidobacteriota bacterium]|nr:tetratricopeptide repeat protein [Acidobacteriota bacterium]